MKELVVVAAVVVAAGCDRDRGYDHTSQRSADLHGARAVSGQHFSIGLPDRPSKGAEGIPKAHSCSLSPLSLGCVW